MRRERRGLQLLAAYLQRRKRGLAICGLFFLVFAGVLSLYNLPVEAVAYAALLCICMGCAFLGFDCWKYGKRHQLLSELKNHITLDIAELPLPGDLLEQDYQQLLEILFHDKRRLAADAEQVRRELMEYYTLWAHQIKTPISAMSLLLQSEENEQSPELLGELLKIEQYVEMVLQYLRVESPSSDFVLKRYSLDGIVRQAVHKLAQLFVCQGINLDFSELDCEVLTDEKWLVFVIGQVLSNALKYSKEGTISIYLEDREEKTLVIQDTGIGIPSEDLPRVFEQGFTGYIGRIEKRSTGIGLYLCKRILTKLSHTIELESAVGEGTKVKIGLETVDTMVE